MDIRGVLKIALCYTLLCVAKCILNWFKARDLEERAKERRAEKAQERMIENGTHD